IQNSFADRAGACSMSAWVERIVYGRICADRRCEKDHGWDDQPARLRDRCNALQQPSSHLSATAVAISQPHERLPPKYLSHPRKRRSIPRQQDWRDERRCPLLVRVCRPFSLQIASAVRHFYLRSPEEG